MSCRPISSLYMYVESCCSHSIKIHFLDFNRSKSAFSGKRLTVSAYPRKIFPCQLVINSCCFVIRGFSVDCYTSAVTFYTVGKHNVIAYTFHGKLDITLPLDKPQNLVLMRPGDHYHSVSIPALAGEFANLTGSFGDMKISGSNFYEQYAPIGERLNMYQAKMSDDRDAYEKEYQRLVKNEKKNRKQMDANKAAYIKSQEKLYAELKKEMTDYIKSNPRSEVSATLLQAVETDSLESVVKKFNYYVRNGRMKPVIEAMLKNAENERLAKAAKEAIKPGVVAPDFTLDDINGKPFTLSSLRGKYVVLDFWGSWCGWCIKGMPDMKKYYEKYRGKFEIVGVDCNDSVEKWKKAVKDNQLPWLHVYNKAADGTPEKYAVEGYPTKIIINPDGTINKVIVGESPDFYKYLDELFK